MKPYQALSAVMLACMAVQPLFGADEAPAARAATREERVNLNFRATPI